MREIRPSGSTSGDVETEHGWILWHWQPKGPANKHGQPKPPHHSSTLLVWAGAQFGLRSLPADAQKKTSAEMPVGCGG